MFSPLHFLPFSILFSQNLPLPCFQSDLKNNFALAIWARRSWSETVSSGSRQASLLITTADLTDSSGPWVKLSSQPVQGQPPALTGDIPMPILCTGTGSHLLVPELGPLELGNEQQFRSQAPFPAVGGKAQRWNRLCFFTFSKVSFPVHLLRYFAWSAAWAFLTPLQRWEPVKGENLNVCSPWIWYSFYFEVQ